MFAFQDVAEADGRAFLLILLGWRQCRMPLSSKENGLKTVAPLDTFRRMLKRVNRDARNVRAGWRA
jgi:hypothetical protein